MKTFEHPNCIIGFPAVDAKWVKCVWAGSLGYHSGYEGKIFKIKSISSCSGKRGLESNKYRCSIGGPIECPGYLVLEGFDHFKSPNCPSYGNWDTAKCIFEFYIDKPGE